MKPWLPVELPTEPGETQAHFLVALVSDII